MSKGGGGTSCCHCGCPATVPPPLRAGLSGSGRDSPSLLYQGMGKPEVRNTKEKQNVSQKSVALEMAGASGTAFGTPVLRMDGSSLQIHQLPEMGDGSFYLKALAKFIPA